VIKPVWLVEIQQMFEPFPWHARLHEARRRRAENYFAMGGDVIGMRVADEYLVGPGLGFVRVEPQTQGGKAQISGAKLDRQQRHQPR
jgi:hypothetical protein